MDNISLYDKTNINLLICPNNNEAKYAYDYLVPMIENDIQKYIKNIKTDLKILKIDDILLPININEKEYENSYVSSLYTHYISYVKEELNKLQNPFLEFILNLILNILGFFYKLFEINKVIYVNNWFLSTNLYIDLSENQYNRITKFLKEKFSDYAIVFCSLNENLQNKEISFLKNLDYKMLGSRQVYIFERDNRKKLKGKFKNKLNKDIKLLENSKYKIFNLKEENINDSLNLYNQLYLDKYSKYNPQYTKEFFNLCFEKKLLNFKILSNSNQVFGMFGYYIRNNILTTPVFGYDMTIKKEEGLYKMLSAQLILEAEKKQCVLHMSSGASKFKLYRGALASIEYCGLLYKHLPLYRKTGYKLLCFIINKIAIPLIQNKEL